jgi:ATP-dependent Clp protease ATP-binding subunit ClpA
MFARLFLGNPDGFVRIDCSTYKEAHSISRLIGSPPGYVGFNGDPELSQKKLDFHGNVLLNARKKKKSEINDQEEKDKIRKELATIINEIHKRNQRCEQILERIYQIEDIGKYDRGLTTGEISKYEKEIGALREEFKRIEAELIDLDRQQKDIVSIKPKEEKESSDILPPSIILFDEIEKMHPEITRALLPMLDSGIIPLANGDRVNFRSCFIFMTSNIGSAKMAQILSGKRGPIGFSTNTSEKETAADSSKNIYDAVMEEIKISQHFPTELTGRIGKENFVVFHHLEKKEMDEIIDNQLYLLLKRYQKVIRGLQIEFADSLKNYIFEETQDEVNKTLGARPIENVILDKVAPALVNLIIKGKDGGISTGDSVKIEAINFSNKIKIVVSKYASENI